MSGPESPEKGQVEARTAAAAEFPAAAEAGLDLGLADRQLDLLGAVAETSNAARRGAGRPAGSANRRNAETFDHLEALGFKAPERRLMEVVSADVRQLARQLGAEPIEVLKLQIKAAADLMPYKLAKRPQAIDVTKRTLGMFLAGRLTPEQEASIERNQWLSVDEAVRENENASHAEGNCEPDQGDSTT